LKSDHIVNKDKKKGIKCTLFKLPVMGFCGKQLMVTIDLCNICYSGTIVKPICFPSR